MRLWRVTNARFAPSALDGAGAFAFGGRWNSPGRRMIYAAPSVAAAALEIVAHAGSVVERYVALELDVPKRLLHTIDMAPAPVDWQRRTQWCRVMGDAWFDSGASLGLLVPSAVLGASIPEWNALINVGTPQFAKVRVLQSLDLWLDERLGPS